MAHQSMKLGLGAAAISLLLLCLTGCVAASRKSVANSIIQNTVLCRDAFTSNALHALPSLYITASPDDLFSSEKGIYFHPLEHGDAWERPATVEMFETNGRPAFQCRCGLRIHGGMSRDPRESPKHSFRLVFKRRYGVAKLRHPIFGNGGAREFDTLILRAGNNDSWLDSDGRYRPRATYIRDEWIRRSMADM